MRYRIRTRIKRVEQRFRTIKTWKDGDSVLTAEEDLGWYVTFQGSWEALSLGKEQPNLKKGQEIDIIIVPVEE